MTWAMLVPRKGTEFAWVAKRAAKFIDQLGHSRVTLRCENEPAIEALARKQDCSRETARRRKPVQWDHRARSRACCRPSQNTESCIGTSYRDQSPARSEDIVLASGIRCVPDEQVRHRQQRKDTAGEAAWSTG